MTDIALRLNHTYGWGRLVPRLRIAARLRLAGYPQRRQREQQAALRWLDAYVEHCR